MPQQRPRRGKRHAGRSNASWTWTSSCSGDAPTRCAASQNRVICKNQTRHEGFPANRLPVVSQRVVQMGREYPVLFVGDRRVGEAEACLSDTAVRRGGPRQRFACPERRLRELPAESRAAGRRRPRGIHLGRPGCPARGGPSRLRWHQRNQPLRDRLERQFDFDRRRRAAPMRRFIAAAHTDSGSLRLFGIGVGAGDPGLPRRGSVRGVVPARPPHN